MTFILSLLPLLCALLAIADVAYAQEIVAVVAGNRFITSSGDTIQLLGVGLPKSGETASEDARRHLQQILDTAQQAILIADSLVADASGAARQRYVYLSDGRLVNLMMIIDGHGTAAATPVHSMIVPFTVAERTKGAGINLGDFIPEFLREKVPGLRNRDDSASTRASGTPPRSRRSATVQCSATTKKGARCRRMTTNSNGRCWQHQ